MKTGTKQKSTRIRTARRSALTAAAVLGLALITGCNAGGLTPDQKAAANKQWNDARGSVLSSLAEDQFRNGNFDRCSETLEQALRLQPTNVSLHLLQARLAIEQGRLEIADAELQTAARLDPKNAQVDYLSGIVLERWKQPARALAAYNAAAVKDPAELSYPLAIAEMQVQLDRPDEALATLQSRMNQFEHSAALRDEAGELLVRQRKYAPAVEMLRSASVLAADDGTIREHLAVALFRNHQCTDAALILERLIGSPDNSTRADLFAMDGECRLETGDIQQARVDLETATRLNPRSGVYWLDFSRALLQAGDLPRAELAVKRSLSLTPEDADAQCLLGYLRLKQDRPAEALAAFEAGSKLDPADSASVSLQGIALKKLGRNALAREKFTAALEMNPNDVMANRMMRAAVSVQGD